MVQNSSRKNIEVAGGLEKGCFKMGIWLVEMFCKNAKIFSEHDAKNVAQIPYYYRKILKNEMISLIMTSITA